MVGLNHEFARELLWREYPTDQRGSYFRQFWDVSSFFAGVGARTTEALRETLRDIPPLHRVVAPTRGSAITMRASVPVTASEELVLVIRGELLKRYPGAVIYAQAAEWAMPNGDIDPSKERSLVASTPGEKTTRHARSCARRCTWRKIEPDIYFLGFDLTIPEALGGDGARDTDPPGWFFVIKERPGEPRFGFDETSRAADRRLERSRMGSRADDGPEASSRYPALPRASRFPRRSPAGRGREGAISASRIVHVRWDDDVSAAELAYIMYQAPVMVAIHAAEMLPRIEGTSMSDFDATRLAFNKPRERARAAARGARPDAARDGAPRSGSGASAERTAPGPTQSRASRRSSKRARAEETRQREAVHARSKQVAENERAFAKLADPRDAIARLSGETPILLLPVRLETRFRRIERHRRRAR